MAVTNWIFVMLFELKMRSEVDKSGKLAPRLLIERIIAAEVDGIIFK